MGSNEYPMNITKKKTWKNYYSIPNVTSLGCPLSQVAGEAADAGAGGRHGRAGDGGDLGIAHLETPRRFPGRILRDRGDQLG